MGKELAAKVILKQDFANMRKGAILTLRNNDYWGQEFSGRSVYIHPDVINSLPNIFEEVNLLSQEEALAKRLNLTVKHLRAIWHTISMEVFVNCENERVYNDWVEKEKTE
jgi:hypothetical protein